MRHWKTKLTALCAAAAMLLPMTGCSLTASAEELFTLPEFPVEYTGLSNQLNALLGLTVEKGLGHEHRVSFSVHFFHCILLHGCVGIAFNSNICLFGGLYDELYGKNIRGEKMCQKVFDL